MNKFILVTFFQIAYFTLNAQVNLTQGLIAYYPFNGDANDMSGNNINGAVSNALLTSDRFGQNNSAYIFNGTDSYIQLPFSNLYNFSPTGSFSLSAWVQPDNNNYGGVLIKAPYNANIYLSQWNYGLYIISNKATAAYHNNVFLYSNTTFTINQCWYLYTITYDNGIWKLYINGKLEKSDFTQTNKILQDGSSAIAFGKKGEAFGDFYKGKMDEVRIYNRAITEDEINALSRPGLIDFTFDQTNCDPLSVAFTSTSANYQNLTWDFGNSIIINNDNNPVITFNNYGVYPVKLKVTTPDGCRDSVTKSIPLYIRKDSLIITNDTLVCKRGDFQLQAVPAFTYCWSPTTGLSDPHIANPVITTTLPTTTYYLYSLKTSGQNLIVNGDFSQGFTGFTSDYDRVDLNITSGQYWVGKKTIEWNDHLTDCRDHTDGGINMMLVDGAPNPNTKVWGEKITVTPNTTYAFSCWLESTYADNPAQLQFFINGSLIGPVFTASSTPCEWKQFYTTWNSGDATTVDIAIVNQNTIYNGNDFALDDISFAELGYVKDSVTVTINQPPTIDFNYSIPLCKMPQFSGVIVNVPNPIVNWNWDFGDNTTRANQSLSHSYSKGGDYSVQLVATDQYACTDTMTKTIRLDTITAIITPDTVVCPNSSFTLHGSGGETYEWEPAALLDTPDTPDPTATIATKDTRYRLKIKNSIGCQDTASVLASIFNPGFIQPPNGQICMDSSIHLNPVPNPAYQYIWNPAASLDNPASPDPIASPRVSTEYTFSVKEPLCGMDTTFKVSIRVNPLPFFVLPNAFTPNGDGVNDCFGISRWGNATIEEFGIYSRWGQRIFSTSDTAICWDGTIKGSIAPAGTYVYVIKARTVCGTLTRKGSLILMR